MKNITINGNEQKTSLDENFKMTLEPITDFSTQLKVLNIESLDELKNAFLLLFIIAYGKERQGK